MVYERVRGWTLGRSLPVHKFIEYPPKMPQALSFPALSQGLEEMCLSLEHQNPSKTIEKMGYFDRVTVSSLHILYTANQETVRARKIDTSCLGRPSGDLPCASEDMACG